MRLTQLPYARDNLRDLRLSVHFRSPLHPEFSAALDSTQKRAYNVYTCFSTSYIIIALFQGITRVSGTHRASFAKEEATRCLRKK